MSPIVVQSVEPFGLQVGIGHFLCVLIHLRSWVWDDSLCIFYHFFSRYLIRYFCQKFAAIQWNWSPSFLVVWLPLLEPELTYYVVRERLASNEWLPSHSILVYHSSMSIFAWDKPLNLLKSYTSLLACFIKNQRLSQNVPNAAVADRFSCLSNVLSCAESTLRNGLLLQHQLIVRLLVALVTLGSFHLGAPDNLSTGKVHFEGCLARGCDEGWGKTKATWFQGPHLSSFCWTCLYHKAKPKLQAVQQEGLCKCRKFGWLWFWLYIFAKWNIHQTDTGRDERGSECKKRSLTLAAPELCTPPCLPYLGRSLHRPIGMVQW